MTGYIDRSLRSVCKLMRTTPPNRRPQQRKGTTVVDDNLLVRCMPADIAEDLMGAGASFDLASGGQVERDMLTGSHVFIVTSGIASKFLVNIDGRISEVGMVGREGMFPVCGLLQVPGAQHLVLSQVGRLSGRVLRTKDFHNIVQASDEAIGIVRRYVYSFLTQVATNLLATEQNNVEARIARWLLMCHDRTIGDVIDVTHETLANMSYAHRPTVTRLLNGLRDRDLVRTERGQIEILSRPGLVELAVGSYGAAAQYYTEHICPFGKGIA